MTNPVVEALYALEPDEIVDIDPDEPYRYGWRYVERTRPDGSINVEQVPLTLDDVLHPQMDDHHVHNSLHNHFCHHLKDTLLWQVCADPTAVVFHGVGIVWDVPGLRGHSPDVTVIFRVCQFPDLWETFRVAEEGTRPALIVEITSPSTRRLDHVDKVQHYAQAGVSYYGIVDIIKRKRGTTLRLMGYRLTPSGYTLLELDADGQLWLEPMHLWLGTRGHQLVCYDATGMELVEYVEMDVQLRKAEARAQAEAESRAAVESRLRELEAELRRLQGQG